MLILRWDWDSGGPRPAGENDDTGIPANRDRCRVAAMPGPNLSLRLQRLGQQIERGGREAVHIGNPVGAARPHRGGALNESSHGGSSHSKADVARPGAVTVTGGTGSTAPAQPPMGSVPRPHPARGQHRVLLP